MTVGPPTLRRLGIAAVPLVLISTLSACSSGPTGTSEVAAGDDVPAAALDDARALLDKYQDVPEFVAPGPALDATPLAGSRILSIEMDQAAQQLVSINEGITQATDAAGLGVRFFNAAGSPATAQQGIQQAIDQKYDAIILNGVPPELVTGALPAAAKAGIPIITATTGLEPPTPIFGASSPDFELAGELMAAAAVAHQNGGKVEAGALQFTNPAVPLALAGIEKVFDSCDGACTITVTDTVEPFNWPTQAAQAASSMVKANPNLNTILAIPDDTYAQFATVGVKSSGTTSVSVVGYQGSGEAPLNVVAEGGPFIADPGQSAFWIGWGAVDQVLRGLLDMEPGANLIPPRYIDKDTLADADPSDPASLYGDAYVDGFKNLWGVS